MKYVKSEIGKIYLLANEQTFNDMWIVANGMGLKGTTAITKRNASVTEDVSELFELFIVYADRIHNSVCWNLEAAKKKAEELRARNFEPIIYGGTYITINDTPTKISFEARLDQRGDKDVWVLKN